MRIGESFPGHHAHPRAHLFGDVESNGSSNQRPEQRVAVLRSGLRIKTEIPPVIVTLDVISPGPPPPAAASDAAAVTDLFCKSVSPVLTRLKP